MGQISHFLTPRGYTLPVLPEMDDLTVGGLFMGVGIETSSHKFGLFNDSVVSAEVVLSSGEVVTCSKNQNAELFDALPWSYGTLGFLASVTIRIVPCKPFVRVEYMTFKEQKASVEAFAKFSESDGLHEMWNFVLSYPPIVFIGSGVFVFFFSVVVVIYLFFSDLIYRFWIRR
jgi:FAD/FMN-containing dehydrogenase